MRRGGLLLSFSLLVFAVLGWRLYGTLENGGAFQSVESTNTSTCTSVQGILGPEDIEIDRERGFVYVSSHDRRTDLALKDAETSVRGSIFLYDLNSPVNGFINLTPLSGEDGTPINFKPHGLSFHKGADGAKTLMVVSHPKVGGDTIEIFDIREVSSLDDAGEETIEVYLQHRKSVTGPALISPNDVVAVDGNRFYATNDHGSRNSLVNMAEDYLRLNLGSVAYYDGEKLKLTLKGQTYANGINVSAGGDEIYVTETTDRRVSVYERDPASGALTPMKEWYLDFGVDNVDVASDGALWIGGHSNMFNFIAHAQDPSVLSPGNVTRIQMDSDTVLTFLTTDGREISGLSVAAEHEGQVVIGQVFDDGLLICE
jgi:arylesterase / paraoxonase